MSGTIERFIVESIHHGGEQVPHDDEQAAYEEVYLVSEDRLRVWIPLELAGDLETGTRARVPVSTSSAGVVANSTPEVLFRPAPRSAGAPRRTNQHLPYAVVKVSAPDILPNGATAADVRGWVTQAQSFYDEEAPGAFTFSIQAEYEITWNSTACGSLLDIFDVAVERFAIPDDLGVIVLARFNTSCNYPAGVASLSAGRPGGTMILNTSSGPSAGLFIHELGHNLGLRHATRWRCDSGTSPLSPGAFGCVKYEYGVRLNTMGGGVISSQSGAIDAHQRWQLGDYGASALMTSGAETGSALLLDHELPVAEIDDGSPVTQAGERVVRALHLRDSLGEAWIVMRRPPLPLDRTPAITIAYRTNWGKEGHPEPMQLDTTPGTAEAERTWLAPSAFDLITAGGSVRTPGGTVITVKGSVDAGPYGTALRVTWQGSTQTHTTPSAPAIIATGSSDQVLTTDWVAASGSRAVLQGTPPEAVECELVDGGGVSLARWRSTSIVPVPGPEWRGAQDETTRYSAWSPSASKSLLASWRFPLTGGFPQDGASAPLSLTGSEVSLRTRCINSSGTTTQSPAVTLRVDSTPPRVAKGKLSILGLSGGQVAVTHGIGSARPLLRLSIPTFFDNESGLGKRIESCTVLSPVDATVCYAPFSVGKGTVRTGVVDLVGNRSALQKVSYHP